MLEASLSMSLWSLPCLLQANKHAHSRACTPPLSFCLLALLSISPLFLSSKVDGDLDKRAVIDF